uniref:Caltractin-like n=1 Tax=Ciona intestinalis TaxID=7719 RepID=F7ALF0_CIOIN|nr:caltractin-like isoform X1 [Ciona intestinalis]|eukprot:XP_002120146.1 caltractin-like isoform X1 [Ciona intestinalis]
MPSKKKRKSISEDKKAKAPDFQYPTEAIPSNIPDIPPPGQALLTVLQSNEVNEKQFLGLKLPTKIFEQLTIQEIRDLKVVFDAFDLDNSSTIDIKELHRAMKILGFQVSRNEVRDMMADVDTQNRGEISFADFLLFIIERQSDSRDILEEIRHGFKMFVDPDEGLVTATSLKKVCRDAGVKFNDKEIANMMEVADTNGDEVIDEDEFLAIMLKTNLF